MDASAGALTAQQRPHPPPWTESGAWLLWGFLSCGLLVGAGFLWIGARYRRRAWLWLAGFYGTVSLVFFVVVSTAPEEAPGQVDETTWQDVVGIALFLVLVAGLVHTVLVQVQQPRPVAPVWYPPAGATYVPPAGWPQAQRPSSGGFSTWPGVPYPVPTTPGAPVATGAAPWPATAGAAPWPATVRATSPEPREPWAGFVRSAEQARERFRRSAEGVRPGPLHDTLGELGARIDTSVGECRRIAAGGQVLADARAGIDTAAIARALAEAEARQAADPDDPRDSGTVVALRNQQATAERMDRVIDDTVGQLRLLDARLGEAVARMFELSAQAALAASVPELSGDVDTLVTDLEALRLAVEEAHTAGIVTTPMPVLDQPPTAPQWWDQPM